MADADDKRDQGWVPLDEALDLVRASSNAVDGTNVDQVIRAFASPSRRGAFGAGRGPFSAIAAWRGGGGLVDDGAGDVIARTDSLADARLIAVALNLLTGALGAGASRAMKEGGGHGR